MADIALMTRLAMRASLLSVITLALGSALAFATPEEDYEQGLSAYDRDDVVAALAPLERAVAADHVPAMVLLANILDKASDDARAVELYRRAIELGSAEAEFGLGGMYAAGEGVERSTAEAVRWIRGAAEKGYGPAIVALADAYATGQLDLEQNEQEAVVWLERGVDLDYEPARAALNRLVTDTETDSIDSDQ